MQDLIGRRIHHYKIDAWLGGGGMGDVYRAHHQDLDISVAVKVMKQELARQSEFQGRFFAENFLLILIHFSQDIERAA